MDQLTTNDLEQILSLASKAQLDSKSLIHIQNYITAQVKRNSSTIISNLTKEEIQQLAADKPTNIIMIALFLIKNIVIEFIRKRRFPYNHENILVQDYWQDIEELFIKKLFLSREVCSYFNCTATIDSKRYQNLINAVQTIELSDTSFEEFVSQSGKSIIRLYLNGRYELLNIDSSANDKEYTLYDLTICFHYSLYDAFKFEELQSWATHRHLNTCVKKKEIDSIFTIKFSTPNLTVLKTDGTFLKIKAADITNFLDKKLAQNEIDAKLYQAIKKEYPKLFFPPMDAQSINSIYNKIKAMIDFNLQEANRAKKPLLILLSEVHGSKESFLLHVIILLIAKKQGISNLLAETINIYHEQYGCDAQVAEMLCLIAYAGDNLGFHIKDLEASLHYNGLLSPYPYREIPLIEFGEKLRESSWIIDVIELDDNCVMTVGSGHLENILNSELQNTYWILPIDCTGDREFSDMLQISHHNFIEIDKSLQHFTLDKLIKMIECSIDKSN